VFVVVAAASVPLRISSTHGAWFTVDDWDYLSGRTVGNAGDLFRAHYEHWSTLIVIAYRALWSAFGLRYRAYELFAIVLYLAVAALVRVVARRAGAGPWTATVAASLLVLLGIGIENNFFTSALVFGLTQLLLSDHDGPVDWRDYAGLAAGLAALMCSALGVAMVFVVGVAALLRRGWRIALLHTAPLAAAYLLWLVAAPAGQSASSLHAQGFGDVVSFVARGFGAGFDHLGAVTGFGILVVAVLGIGASLLGAHDGLRVVRGRAAPAVALLAGAVVFLVLTGAARSGSGTGILHGVGPEHARAGRYAYVVAVMLLPALALAVDAIVRRWHLVAWVLVALLAVSVPARIHDYRSAGREFAAQNGFNRVLVLSAPRLPLAHQLPRDLSVSILGGGGPPLGWLLDSLPSGRIPAAPALTPESTATETLTLALRRTRAAPPRRCTTVTRPTNAVLTKGGVLGVRSHAVDVVYLPSDDVTSLPRRLPVGSVVALAGPLRLRILPVAHAGRPAVVCR